MNDIKRAIETLKARKKFLADINFDAHYAYDLSITALEKQIPKKAKQYIDKSIFIYAGVFYCPSCQENVSMDDVYCCQCGQKIDWEAE